jgi:hypothetical protein
MYLMQRLASVVVVAANSVPSRNCQHGSAPPEKTDRVPNAPTPILFYYPNAKSADSVRQVKIE